MADLPLAPPPRGQDTCTRNTRGETRDTQNTRNTKDLTCKVTHPQSHIWLTTKGARSVPAPPKAALVVAVAEEPADDAAEMAVDAAAD